MTTPNEPDQDKKQAKEVIRQEQFWFTATTLGFIGLVGAALKTPSLLALLISEMLIAILSVFTIWLIVGRYKVYLELTAISVSSWREALYRAFTELSGTLYCIAIVFFAWIGFMLIILMNYCSPQRPG